MKTLTKIDWEKAKSLFTKDKPNLITSAQNKLNQYPHVKTILFALACGAGIGLAAISPSAPLAYLSLVKFWQSFNKKRLKQTIFRFRQQKYVDIKEEDGQYVVKITTKGLEKALSYKLEEMKIKEPENWDGKWRVAIFDISNKKRYCRDFFRNKIKALGLYRLQKSVYVYPYPCFDQIEFLRQIFGVGLEVKYILAEKIEEDENLLNHFQL